MNTKSLCTLLFSLIGLLPLAGTAATFRHQVNPPLQTADPDVSTLTPSPDGSKIYYISNTTGDDNYSSYRWFSVPTTGGAATLLANDGPISEVEITSDGAYLVGKSGSDLIALSTTTGTVTVLADPVGSLNQWSVSPDGQWLAYQMNSESLHVIAMSGGTSVEVTPSSAGNPHLPSWKFLPDSSAVVFSWQADTLDDNQLYAYSLPLSTGSLVMLSESAGGDIGDFEVAPDSSRAVYEQDQWVYSVKPDGTGRITISDYYTSAREIVISEDSTTVYWSNSNNNIEKSSLTSNTSTSLITGGSVDPTWTCKLGVTSDGTQLIFIGDDGSRNDFYSLSTAGGTPVLINSASPGIPEPETNFGYLILPNSQRILYLSDEDASGTTDLMSGRIDGTGSARLDRASLGGSDWTDGYSSSGIQDIAHVLPDSSYVIYSHDEVVAGKTEIFAIHPNGTGRTKLNATLSTDSNAAPVVFAADDSFLLYSGDHNGDRGVEPWFVTLPGFASSQVVDLPDEPLDVVQVHVPDDDVSTLFYSAYQDSAANFELFAVPYAGGTPVKLNDPLPAGYHSAGDFQTAPGAENLVYDVYDYNYGYRSYHGKSDGSASSLMLAKQKTSTQFTADGSTVYFMAESPTVAGQNLIYRQYFAGGAAVVVSPPVLDVSSYQLSSDGSTIVMIASSGTAYLDEVYSMPAAGGTPVKLNPTLTASGDVRSFAITPDSSTVVFVADAIAAGSSILFSSPIGGGGSSVLVPSSGSSQVRQLSITPDSATAVFIGDFDTDAIYEIYSVPIAGGARVKLNLPFVVGGSMDYEDDFVLTADGNRVIYLADGDTLGSTELYSAKTDGSSTVKLNGPLVASGGVYGFQVSADGSWVAYEADQNTDNTWELFHVASTGGAVTRLHPAYASTRDTQFDYQIIGNDRLIFRADHGGADDQIRLFCTKVPGFVTNRLDNNSLAEGDVISFEAAENGEYVTYRADQTTDGGFDLYVVYGVPDITPIPDVVGLINAPIGPLPFTIGDLESPAANLTLTAVSSNPTLLSDAGITIGGVGVSRSLTLLPNAGQWGLATITVMVSDGVHEAQISFNARFLPDPNDPPTGVGVLPNAIAENAPAGTQVGILKSQDLDLWDIHTYALVGGATTEFTIVGDRLLTNNVFNYETAPSYNIIVRTTDFAGLSWNQFITVNVIDLAGKPGDFSRVGIVNQFFPLSDAEFIGNFEIHDGPALERIRIDAVPAHGKLTLRFPEELIDGGFSGPRSLAAGDINGDTRIDLVAAGSTGGTHVLAWYEQVAGSPRFPVPAGLHAIDSGAAISQINDVAVADLDRDGDMDLVASCGAPNNTVYLYQNMGGAPPVFARTILTTAAVNPISLKVAKIDGDPEWDIVLASSGDNNVRVYRRNNLPGLFYHPVDIASSAETGVAEIAVSDIDKDGLADIACADPTSSEAVWLRNNGGVPPVFTRRVAGTLLSGNNSIALGDMNKDGDMDIIVASQFSNRIDWLESDGATPPGFSQRILAPGISGPSAIAVGDLDGDFDQDVVALAATTGRMILLENNGAPIPSFVGLEIDSDCPGAACVIVRDLDGDGKPDLATGANTANDLSWYPNSKLMTVGQEVDIDETRKLVYQPNPGFVGIDSFDWSGHDGVQWSFDSATVTFSVYGSEYWNWLASNFTLPVINDASQRETLWGSTADADQDGVNNISEYALGGDPNDASDLPGLTAGISEDSGLDYLFGSYPFRKNEVSLSYLLEVSTDLETWNSGGAYLSHVTPDTVVDPFFDEVTYKVLTDTATEAKQFLRLRVVWALD